MRTIAAAAALVFVLAGCADNVAQAPEPERPKVFTISGTITVERRSTCRWRTPSTLQPGSPAKPTTVMTT